VAIVGVLSAASRTCVELRRRSSVVAASRSATLSIAVRAETIAAWTYLSSSSGIGLAARGAMMARVALVTSMLRWMAPR